LGRAVNSFVEMEPIRIITSPNAAKKTKFSFSEVNQWFSKR
jgi:hypothetical protein